MLKTLKTIQIISVIIIIISLGLAFYYDSPYYQVSAIGLSELATMGNWLTAIIFAFIGVICLIIATIWKIIIKHKK